MSNPELIGIDGGAGHVKLRDKKLSARFPSTIHAGASSVSVYSDTSFAQQISVDVTVGDDHFYHDVSGETILTGTHDFIVSKARVAGVVASMARAGMLSNARNFKAVVTAPYNRIHLPDGKKDMLMVEEMRKTFLLPITVSGLEGEQPKFTDVQFVSEGIAGAFDYLQELTTGMELRSRPETNSNMKIAVIGIGHSTVDFVTARGNTIQMKDSRVTYECATNEFLGLLNQRLIEAKIYKADFDRYKLIAAAETGKLVVRGDTIDITKHIEHCVNVWTKHLSMWIKNQRFSWDTYDKVILIGGGTHLIRNVVKPDWFGNHNPIIPTDPEFANVRGAYKLAVRAWYKKNG